MGGIWGRGEAEVGENHRDATEEAVGEDLADDVRLRQVPRPHRLHDEHARCPTHLGHRPRLGGGHGDRLLDVLAVRDGRQRLLEVQRVGRSDVDGVDARVGDERLDATGHGGDAVTSGELSSPLGTTRRHGDSALRRVGVECRHEAVRDAGSDDAPRQGRCGVGSMILGLGSVNAMLVLVVSAVLGRGSP